MKQIRMILFLIAVLETWILPGFLTAEGKDNKIKMIGLYSAQSTVSSADPFSQTKFVPRISLILDFSYARRNIENEVFHSLEVPGFIDSGSHDHGDGHAHAPVNATNGFNFNYGELVLFAAVDPYFDLFSTFHFSGDSFELEEAYVTSRRLPLGFKLKLGKFLSAFGRLNSQHAHIWDFSDIPLVYRAFFGEEALSEVGVQLNWVAPTDFFLLLGVESLQGTNENSFGIQGFHVVDTDTEEELEIEETALPNLWTFFGKTSLEKGDLIILAGVSYAIGKSRSNHLEEGHGAYAFAGDSKILGLDFTAKYIFSSYRYLSLQLEYLSRITTGLRYEVHEDHGEPHGEDADAGDDNHDAPEVEIETHRKNQAGFYAQLIYRLHRLWRFGTRWDRLNKNNIRLNELHLELPQNLNRYSFMLDYSPSEFSRIRLQYNINRYTFLEDRPKNFHQFVIQFNLAIGAHGAHPF